MILKVVWVFVFMSLLNEVEARGPRGGSFVHYSSSRETSDGLLILCTLFFLSLALALWKSPP